MLKLQRLGMVKQYNSISENPILLGGIGEMKSNGGTQYYQQDRVYDSMGIAMCHPANLPGGSYLYLVIENDTKTTNKIK